MTKNMKRVRRQSFTLVEVIAVLLVIAILAAVAAPKFVSMATEARNGVARAGINEAKASLSVAFAKAYLTAQGGTVTTNAVMVAANLGTNPVTFGDITVNLTEATGNIAVAAVAVKGTTVTGITDTWNLPTGY
jgi:prepilin-type N-terminal cleavage/methylation domain-containing protein